MGRCFLRAWCGGAAWVSLFTTSTFLTADTLYVCNHGVSTISALDVSSGDIVTSIISPDPLTLCPDYIAAAPDGKTACVLFEDSNQVSVIDLTTNTIKKTLAMQAIVDARTPAVSPLAMLPDGTKAYVVHGTDCSVSVIDMAAGAEIGAFSVGTKGTDFADSIALSPDGRIAYVTRSSETVGAVVALNTDTNGIIGIIPLEGFCNPGPIAIAPDGLKAYVGEASDVVLVLDLQGNKVIGRIEQWCEPCFITFDPSGGTAYVVLSSGVTQVIDGVRDANRGIIATASATQLVFAPDGKRMFANNQADNCVSVIDREKEEVTGAWTGLSYPYGIALTSSDLSMCYVPSAPVACRARIKKSSHKKRQVVLSWKKSPSVRVVRYDVYLGRKRIGSVDASSALSFSTKASRERRKSRSKRSLQRLVRKYSIRAVAASGLESQSVHPK